MYDSHSLFFHLLTICQHNHVAFCTYENGQMGVLKLVPQTSREVEILNLLSNIKDRASPILPGLQVTHISSAPLYSLIVMPRGVEISDTDDFLSLAAQLVSGIMFLHAHNVVHLDIKRRNLVMLSGKLCIIDYSISEVVEPGTLLHGFRGTPGCVAPEVEMGGSFDPFLADVWACGNVLIDLFCEYHQDSGLPNLSAIVSFIQYMVAESPLKRASLAAILTAVETACRCGSPNLNFRKRKYARFPSSFPRSVMAQ